MNKNCFFGYLSGYIDYPNKYSTTLFFNTCNLACSYCFNKMYMQNGGSYSFDDLKKYILTFKKMFGYKYGVVLSGGEPTINDNFVEIVHWLNRHDIDICLHTNGVELVSGYNLDAVILSLKHEDDFPEKKGMNIIINERAKKFYDENFSCKYKEIRFVSDSVDHVIVNYIGNDWVFKTVPMIHNNQ